MLSINCSKMIIFIVVMVMLTGNYEITTEAYIVCSHRCNTCSKTFNCTHPFSNGKDFYCGNINKCFLKCSGGHCVHSCNPGAATCALVCDRNTSCTQNCHYQDGKCTLKCHGQSCDQACNGNKCNLEFNGRSCTQNCNEGECDLECHAGHCVQTCNGNKCSLECNGETCTQTCNGGECDLECHAGHCEQTCNEDCDLKCHGGNCNQNCAGVKDSCHLHCPTTPPSALIDTCQQECPNNKYRCSIKVALRTEAPTTASEDCSLSTGTLFPQSTQVSTTAVLPVSLQSSTAASPSSLVTTQAFQTSLLLHSSTQSTPSILMTSLTSALTKLSPSTATPSLTLTRTASNSSSSSASPSTATTSNTKNMSRVEELVRKFLSTLNRTDVQQESSLQDAVNLFQNTTEQLKANSVNERKLNFKIEQERNSFIFKLAFALEDFAMKYGQYHLNKSHPQLNNTYRKLVLRIERFSNQNTSDFLLEGPEKQNVINIPGNNFHKNDTMLLGIVYKHLHEILTWNPTENKRRLGTIIMAAVMDPKPEKLLHNVALNFRNQKAAEGERFCTFWSDYSKQNPDGWSGEGCHLVASKTNSEETACSCSHFTHFAVLFDFGNDKVEITKTDEKILKILTYVGLALSIIGIILSMICYISLTDIHQPLSQIRVSLTGSLGAAQIIFLAGINATGKTGACVTVAALIQYFLMAAFCWMLVEGIYFYLLVVKVYNITEKMSIYHAMSWGFPAVIVAISLSIAAGKDGIQSFVGDKYCWMSSANNLIWIFAASVAMIEVVNMLILVRVIKEMATMQSTGDNHFQQIRLGIKACVVLVPLLGVTWLFGLLTQLHKAFVYIFTILNSVQGFLIFLLHCVRNSQIKDRIKRRTNAIFPAAGDGKHSKKTSQVNKSDISGVKAIEVQSCSNSVFELK